MKKIKRILSMMLVLSLLIALLASESIVNASSNVTITCKDPVMYDLLVNYFDTDKIISKNDTAMTFVMSQDDVNAVTRINIYYYDTSVGTTVISDITGIEKFTNLERIYIQNENINTAVAREGSFSDLTPLSGLTKLKSLSLFGCDNIDFSIISNLTQLEELAISGAVNADYTTIDNLTNLNSLSLLTCGIDNTEFAEICKLDKLNYLSLGGPNYEKNVISDITPISNLTNLRRLKLDNNQITNIAPLSTLTGITELSIRCNPVTDITPLSSLVNLIELTLGRDGYAGSREGLPINGNIEPLANLINLTRLSMSNCGVTDISVLSSLTKLGRIDFTCNSIKDFSILEAMSSLYYIDVAEQKYTYDVESGEVVSLPTPLLKAMYDTSSILYTEGLDVITSNCTLSDDGRSVIVGERGTANVSAKYGYSGYKFNAKITYNITDIVAPEVSVDYSTTELTKGNVTVNIIANEEIQDIEGYTKVTSRKYKKTYTANTEESIIVKDTGGNTAVANIVIANIDKTAPVVEVTYSTTETTNGDVTVTIEANEEIQSIEGFTKVDAKTYTKVYTANAEESIIVKDIAGNDAVSNIVITNIDKTAPVVEVTYSTTETTNGDVTVTIEANEEIQS
ncbi:MAG: hypothetical protein IJA34_17775, partial [Lachnospiraceae bacterium]|nr:hypothetical protein [Lachnospiraceae bacterium]